MKRILTAVTAGLAIVFLTVPLVSHGTSGSTWHVTVRNPTSYAVQVQVHYTVAWTDMVTIAPGGQHRFDIPGAKCPTGLNGLYSVGGRLVPMMQTSCSGNDKPFPCACWAACCWNTTWEVCHKPGEVVAYEYGFCKQ
jgi:hypothetical protein